MCIMTYDWRIAATRDRLLPSYFSGIGGISIALAIHSLDPPTVLRIATIQ